VLALFVSPNKLIEKRQDKLLDYDSWRVSVERTKDAEKLKMVTKLSPDSVTEFQWV